MTLRKKRRKYHKPNVTPRGYSVRFVIQRAGGAATLAAMLNITRQAVYQWKQIPMEHAEMVSNLSGIPLDIVRPDAVEAPPPKESK